MVFQVAFQYRGVCPGRFWKWYTISDRPWLNTTPPRFLAPMCLTILSAPYIPEGVRGASLTGLPLGARMAPWRITPPSPPPPSDSKNHIGKSGGSQVALSEPSFLSTQNRGNRENAPKSPNFGKMTKFAAISPLFTHFGEKGPKGPKWAPAAPLAQTLLKPIGFRCFESVGAQRVIAR